MPAADPLPPLAPTEAERLFAGFSAFPRILIAVSGGPDSMALLLAAIRWRAARSSGPELLAATVDHGLRTGSAAEAEAVAALCRGLNVPHRTLAWSGDKPATGLSEAARAARYRLLCAHARAVGAEAVALAHTQDDQAETVLFRLARGSGLSGLAGMGAETERDGVRLVRPFLGVPKARLIATLKAAGIGFAVDPTNADMRFARPRLRACASALAAEGLDAARLARLARRLARADAALEAAVDAAQRDLSRAPWEPGAPIRLDAPGLAALPAELALRLLGRAVAAVGTEGEVELGKLEALAEAVTPALATPGGGLRRTLAGALVAVKGDELRIERAPARREGRPLARNSEALEVPVLGKGGPCT